MNIQELEKILKKKSVKNIGKLNKEKILEVINYLETTNEFIDATSEEIRFVKSIGSTVLINTKPNEDGLIRLYNYSFIKKLYKNSYPPEAIHQLGYSFAGLDAIKTIECLELRKEEELKEPSHKILYNAKIGKGVYGIYIDGLLVYIGKTNTTFEKRYKQHLEALNNYEPGGWQQEHLYAAMRLGKEVKFETLVEANSFTNHEIECMEYALITTNKPQYNYQGVVVPYQFTESKRRE